MILFLVSLGGTVVNAKWLIIFGLIGIAWWIWMKY